MRRATAHRQLLEFIAAQEAIDKPPPTFIDDNFPAQAAFIRDPSRQKAALTTRRAGKSFAIALYLYKTAFETPHVQCLYLALTRPSAKAIMWPIMNKLDRQLGLGCRFHATDLTITLPNGSTIRITGADATAEQMERQLGQANALVAIDECASFKSHIRQLVYEVLKPTLVDYKGTLVMIGTPGQIASGLFYDITNGTEPGWSLHQWNTYDNPYMVDNWTDEVDELRATNKYVEETPSFRRNYMGEWVVDNENLIYRFHPDRNFLDTPLPPGEYTYLLGIDLGWEDPTAIVLGAYSDSSNDFYILKAWKKSHALLSEVAGEVRLWAERYGVSHIVIDDASKQAVEEMRTRYQIPFEAAEKHGKNDFIGIMNDDFIMAHIKVVRDGDADALVEEWSNLIWSTNLAGNRVEDPRCDNHCTDAALYAYRYAKHYLSSPKQALYVGKDARLRHEEELMLQQCEDQFAFEEEQRRAPWWESL